MNVKFYRQSINGVYSKGQALHERSRSEWEQTNVEVKSKSSSKNKVKLKAGECEGHIKDVYSKAQGYTKVQGQNFIR